MSIQRKRAWTHTSGIGQCVGKPINANFPTSSSLPLSKAWHTSGSPFMTGNPFLVITYFTCYNLHYYRQILIFVYCSRNLRSSESFRRNTTGRDDLTLLVQFHGKIAVDRDDVIAATVAHLVEFQLETILVIGKTYKLRTFNLTFFFLLFQSFIINFPNNLHKPSSHLWWR